MAFWRNEEDFLATVQMVSEFNINDKKPNNFPRKLNIQKSVQKNSWYESDSEDEPQTKGKSEDCPSMEPMDTLQMMQSIRMQVRNVVGDRYSNDVLEKLYKMDSEGVESSTNVPEVAASFLQVQVSDSDNDVNSGAKRDLEASTASTSVVKQPNDKVKYTSYKRGKTATNNRGRGCAPRYHKNAAFNSLQSKRS